MKTPMICGLRSGLVAFSLSGILFSKLLVAQPMNSDLSLSPVTPIFRYQTPKIVVFDSPSLDASNQVWDVRPGEAADLREIRLDPIPTTSETLKIPTQVRCAQGTYALPPGQRLDLTSFRPGLFQAQWQGKTGPIACTIPLQETNFSGSFPFESLGAHSGWFRLSANHSFETGWVYFKTAADPYRQSYGFSLYNSAPVLLNPRTGDTSSNVAEKSPKQGLGLLFSQWAIHTSVSNPKFQGWSGNYGEKLFLMQNTSGYSGFFLDRSLFQADPAHFVDECLVYLKALPDDENYSVQWQNASGNSAAVLNKTGQARLKFSWRGDQAYALLFFSSIPPGCERLGLHIKPQAYFLVQRLALLSLGWVKTMDATLYQKPELPTQPAECLPEGFPLIVLKQNNQKTFVSLPNGGEYWIQTPSIGYFSDTTSIPTFTHNLYHIKKLCSAVSLKP